MKIYKPHELRNKKHYIKGLIYGNPGIGKSTLACTAPNPVLLDFDNGVDRIDLNFLVPTIPATNYQDLLTLVEGKELAQFETIIIDTLGKMVRSMGDYLCEITPKYRQADGSLTIKGWGAIKEQFQIFLGKVAKAEKHIIFVAHEKEERDGEERVIRPDVSGSSGKDVVQELDFMGYMKAIGNARAIFFKPNEQYYAKNCLGLDEAIKLPDLSGMKDFMAKNFFDIYYKKKEEDNKLMSEFEKLIEQFKTKAEKVKDLKSMNKLYEEGREIKEILSSRLVAKGIVLEKANELDFVYDKESEGFVEKEKE